MTITTNSSNVKSIKIWDKIAEGYSFEQYWMNKIHQAWFKTLISIIGNPCGKSFLEVGCGSAFQSLALAKEGGKVSLLDFSENVILKAQNTFIEHGLSKPNSFVCDALCSNINDKQFDFVWNMGVIEHFSDGDKVKMINEMLRMTKPNGKTIVMVPNSFCFPFQISQFIEKIIGRWKYGKEDDMNPFRLHNLCKKNNLRKYQTFAFDPLSGWYWLPIFGKHLRTFLKEKPVESYLKRSPWGWMSVLIIDVD